MRTLFFFLISMSVAAAQTYNFAFRQDEFCGIETSTVIETHRVIVSTNSAVWYDISNHKIMGPFRWYKNVDNEFNVYIDDETNTLMLDVLGRRAVIVVGWTGSSWLNKTVLANEFID